MYYCFSITESQCNLIPRLERDDAGFEIRLDHFTKVPDAAPLRVITNLPLLATFRSKAHLGQATLAERNDFGWAWRRLCLAAGFDLIDLELDEPGLTDKIAEIHAAGARVVLSHHQLEKGPIPEAVFHKARETKADIIKIIGNGSNTADLRRQRVFYSKFGDRPLVHFYMGTEFTASRVLSLLYGAPFTFLTPSVEQAVAPGQLTMRDVDEIYQPLSTPLETLQLFSVIGAPIGFSKSPAFHNPLLKARDPACLFLALPANNVADYQILRETFPELRGMAVTKPMKEVTFARADHFLDPDSATLGAVNTLVFRKGKTGAANTDLLAMVELLKKTGPKARVRVLGYGGLGKAVVRACNRLNLPTEVCNRTPEKIGLLPFNVVALPWEERHSNGPTVIVQATSVGMAPQTDECPLQDLPHSTQWLIETIYNPLETALVHMAREQGLKVIDGLALFEGQARIQNQFFSTTLDGQA